MSLCIKLRTHINKNLLLLIILMFLVVKNARQIGLVKLILILFLCSKNLILNIVSANVLKNHIKYRFNMVILAIYISCELCYYNLLSMFKKYW